MTATSTSCRLGIVTAGAPAGSGNTARPYPTALAAGRQGLCLSFFSREEGVLGHAVIRIDLRKDHCLEGSALLCVARRAAISSIEAVEFRLHGTRRRDVSPRLCRGHVSASFKDGKKGERCQPPKLENLGNHAVQITQIWWLARLRLKHLSPRRAAETLFTDATILDPIPCAPPGHASHLKAPHVLTGELYTLHRRDNP